MFLHEWRLYVVTLGELAVKSYIWLGRGPAIREGGFKRIRRGCGITYSPFSKYIRHCMNTTAICSMCQEINDRSVTILNKIWFGEFPRRERGLVCYMTRYMTKNWLYIVYAKLMLILKLAIFNSIWFQNCLCYRNYGFINFC